MSFDSPPDTNRSLRSRRNYHDGVAAEGTAANHYLARGGRLLAERWLGESGELDLVVKEGDTFVFVEVKKACDFASAAERITPAKIARITAAAQEFLAERSETSMCYMRFDAALIDASGQIEILENITM